MTSLSNLKISFIGGGNMASALIGGLLHQGAQASNIYVADPFEGTRERLKTEFKVLSKESISALSAQIQTSNVLVLAVKPQQFKEAATELKPVLDASSNKPLCLSVAAGIRTQDMARWLNHQRLIRAMPNTPALIGQGMTGLFASKEASKEDQMHAENICSAVGKITWVSDEKQIDDITAVSGSGPAYVFAFLEAMQSAGVKLGLDAHTARKLAYATLEGATQLAHNSDEHAGVLRERVTSKGGTTAAALDVMKQHGWHEILEKAIDAASQRGKTMGDELGKS